MPKRRIKIVLDTRDGTNVEADFKTLYGGSDDNWQWVKRKLDGMDPAKLKELCVKLGGQNPCQLLKLPPCYVFAQLKIDDEAAWWEGLDKGVLTIEAVVHEDYAACYYQQRVKDVPEADQDE